jgi:hypothetical protein
MRKSGRNIKKPANITFDLRNYQRECLEAIMAGYRAGQPPHKYAALTVSAFSNPKEGLFFNEPGTE